VCFPDALQGRAGPGNYKAGGRHRQGPCTPQIRQAAEFIFPPLTRKS
jgi:hypothetical protein